MTSSRVAVTVFEGVIRVAIFLIYIFLISRTKDIKRTFMYHGAEHKCINCIEHGLELNVENVRKSSKQHKRCGTSFLFFVMIVSVIFCFFITAQSQVMRIVIRLALLPLIAGVSYEIIKLAGNSDNPVVNLLSKPGMWVQNMTTKEPDDSQLEVAIAAIHAVCDEKPCGTYTICKEDVGHYDGHELIESAKEDGDDDRTEKPQVTFVKYRPLQKRRFL